MGDIPAYIHDFWYYDPTVYNNSISNSNTWYDAVDAINTPLSNPHFDQTGNYKHMTVDTHSTQDQLYYFDTVLLEPPDEYDNILLCMNNTIHYPRWWLWGCTKILS